VTASLAKPTHRVFSPARINAIASNTLLELARLKVFYFLLLFALIIIGGSAFMMEFPFHEQFQVLKDLGLGAMSIFTWLLSVLGTAMILPKDIEDRTLYTILAKPVPRVEYLLGKLLGMLWLLLISTLLMSAMFVLALYTKEHMVISEMIRGMAGARQDVLQAALRDVREHAFTASLIPGVISIYIKAAIFAALTLLISTFASSSIFTIIVSFVIYFIGHVQHIAREEWLGAPRASVMKKMFLGLVALLFPDLHLFNLVDDIVAGNAIQMAIFVKTIGLGCAYTFVYAFVAYVIFAYKEL
jgi:ABC-2 type transport system permease protein